jgi:hypothetical protein
MDTITTELSIYPGPETQRCEVAFWLEGTAVEVVSIVVAEDFPEGEEDTSNHVHQLSQERLFQLEEMIWDQVMDERAARAG